MQQTGLPICQVVIFLEHRANPGPETALFTECVEGVFSEARPLATNQNTSRDRDEIHLRIDVFLLFGR